MVKWSNQGVFVFRGQLILEDADSRPPQEIQERLAEAGLPPLSGEQIDREKARGCTMAHQILAAHNRSGDPRNLKLRFDSIASHDITYVGIIQSARAGGLKEFPVPYVLTNCHNSLLIGYSCRSA